MAIPTGGYFGGQDLAMNTWEKKVGINPIVWNAKRAELYDNLSMHHSGFTIHQSTREYSPRLGQMNRPRDPLFLFGNRIERTLCGRRFQVNSRSNCFPFVRLGRSSRIPDECSGQFVRPQCGRTDNIVCLVRASLTITERMFGPVAGIG